MEFNEWLASNGVSEKDMSVKQYIDLFNKYNKMLEVDKAYMREDSIIATMFNDFTWYADNPRKSYLLHELKKIRMEIVHDLLAIKYKDDVEKMGKSFI